MISLRLVLRLSLGILCGVVLVLLPAAFSVGTSPLASPSPSSLGSNPRLAENPSVLNGRVGISSQGSVGLSILIIVFLIFLPSTVFSLVIRRWAERRARDYL